MRTTKTMTISLPPGMVYMFEALRKRENRTRSELVREALRKYFDSAFTTYKPTKSEVAVIKRGREDIRKGRHITLDQFLYELDSKNYRRRK